MDARRIWIATGTLGVLGAGLGATVAAAHVRAGADDPTVVTVDERSAASTAPGAGVVPSPSDVDPSSSTTTVSTNTARTAASPVSPLSPVSAQTSPSAATP